MRSRLFNFASVLSLVLCGATVALWVRTLGKSEPHVIIGDLTGWAQQVVAVRSQSGYLTLYWTTQRPMRWLPTHLDAGPREIVWHIVREWELSHDNGWLSQLGFAWIQFSPEELRQNLPMLSRLIMPGCPHWFIVLLTAILPAFWFHWRLKMRWKVSGGCRQCAYNLTGNASGVCPECGTPLVSPSEVHQ